MSNTFPERLLPLLKDPVQRGGLVLVESKRALYCETSKKYYPILEGGVADLLPEAGVSRLPETEAEVSHLSSDVVRGHYHDRPCHNYLHLDNVPLGKYLRDPAYDDLFAQRDVVIEVGSGKGAIAEAFKRYRQITPICVDQAYGSLRHVLREPVQAPAVLGTNLALPFRDECADIVISHGVIHHTPNPFRCLRELTRILKPEGKLFLAVYNWDNAYRWMYWCMNSLCRLYRWVFGKTLGDLLIMLTLFPGYHIAIWLVLIFVQKRWSFPPLKESWEQFHDFFTTPIAKFYFKDEFIEMADALGLDLLTYEAGGWPGGNFGHFYWFKKRSSG